MRSTLKVVTIIGFLLLIAAVIFIGGPSGTEAQNSTSQPPSRPPIIDEEMKIRLECTGCHGPGATMPKLGSNEQFHKLIHKQYMAGVHSKLQQNGKPAAQCIDCHTLGGNMATDLPPDNPQSTVFATNQEQTCGKCHEKELGTFHNSIHGKLLEKGDTRAAACADCHGNHTIMPVKDAAAQINRGHLTEVCIRCHSGIVPQYESSAHGKSRAAGNDKAPVCIDCHNAISHAAAPKTLRDFSIEMTDKCSSCHEKQAPSYRDTFHGQATAYKYEFAATCADCHTPHHNLPASDPQSSVHQKNIVQTCSNCHKDVTPSFATFNPHAEPTNPEKGFWIYLVNTFMKWLLICVFGFFGLHTVLWLQRSLVAIFRGETHKRIRDDEEQWVVRFETNHRLTHVAIIVSFLALAATGLPLMYSYTDWGRWLVEIHGGLGVTRIVHRIAAVITFGYAFYHLYFVLRKAFVERDWSALYGPQSMNIRKQDFIDAFNMFRWFFYLGPKPKLDRFTYWEKFDYFAVFWGVPVIGLSGLVLWFPGFFSRFLPGEVLNIAMIVHSEEALLATAFIFAFHFFHNHLRPENFPMDIIMFTGKMRLSWFKEERPVEYERHLAEGTLDSIIVPPPSLKFRIFARVFGFIAYIFGLFLVISIFITMLTIKH